MLRGMKRLIVALLIAAPSSIPAAAQVPPAELGARNVPAPWWMREPVIASIGDVRTELPANRAMFDAGFSAVERDAAAATTRAGEKVRELDAALRAFGADRVRVTTGFQTRPLYEQFRDAQGNRVDNERADKIERYEVRANMAIEVRDVAVLERAYAAVIAARPDSVGAVRFALEPTNEAKTWLSGEAVKDAARRARLAADGAGARLGAAKVIDPTGRVCRTDVLAGWPSYVGGGALPTDVQGAPPPPPPPAPAMADIALTASRRDAPPPITVTLQPPLRELRGSACVVYALLP